MRRRKKEEIPVTSIRLSHDDKQTIRIAAAYCNSSYQNYMRRVVLEHAKAVIRAKAAIKIEFQTMPTRKVVFLDE